MEYLPRVGSWPLLVLACRVAWGGNTATKVVQTEKLRPAVTSVGKTPTEAEQESPGLAPRSGSQSSPAHSLVPRERSR